MRVYLDSSAYAKHFIEETGSMEVEKQLGAATMLVLSALVIPEILSALNRLRREHQLRLSDYHAVKRRLADEVRDAEVVTVTEDVVRASVAVLESSAVRTLDALHIATALVSDADLFVTADRRQSTAARKAGLRVRQV